MANKVRVTVDVDSKSAQADLDGVRKSADGLGKSFSDVSKVAGGFALGAAITGAPAVLGGMTSKARDLELQMKKAETVFGDQLGTVKQWASENASAMGLTSNQATNLAAGMADLLVPMGMTREQAAKMSTATIGLSGALAEWSGGQKDAAEVADILQKAYLGETDGLKGLGISISAADVSARLAAKGQKDLTGAAQQQAQALAIQELVMEKSADAQRAFAEGSGSAARKQAEMTAKTNEAKESLAMAFAPAIVLVTTLLATALVPGLTFLTDHMGLLMTVLGAAAAGVMAALVPAFIAWAAAAVPAAVATLAAAAPVIALGAAIAALVVGIVLLAQHWDELTAKYPPLKAASDAVVAGWQASVAWITGTLVPAVLSISKAVGDAVQGAVGSVTDNWPKIQAVIEPALKALYAVIEFQVKQWKTVIETVLGVIKGLVDVFMGVFTGDWDRAWGGVKQILQSAWDGIKGTIENAIGLIKALAPLMLDAGKAIGGAMLDGFKGGLTGTVSFVQDVGQEILRALKAMVNVGIIDPINRAVEFHVGGSILGKDWGVDINPPDIPHLASGGVVTRPTVALIGEAGPEAVVPLTGPNAPRAQAREVNVYIDTVNADTPRRAERAGRSIGWALATRGVAL